jgi:hypothetical protein
MADVAEDYCELCDLPLSQCVHGMPKPAPTPPKAPARAPTQRRTTRASSGPSGTATGSVTNRTKARRYTPPEEVAPLILRVLEDEGGQASADDVLAGVEIALAPSFRPGDEEKGPTGELRWRTAARKARKALSDEGQLVVPEPGVWQLPSR